jgi:hypothetical protein
MEAVMRLSRAILWAVVAAVAASALRAFPEEPSQRAAVVCAPVQWMLSVATAISSAMDDSGHLGPVRPPWREDVHRSCRRIVERVFLAASQA